MSKDTDKKQKRENPFAPLLFPDFIKRFDKMLDNKKYLKYLITPPPPFFPKLRKHRPKNENKLEFKIIFHEVVECNRKSVYNVTSKQIKYQYKKRKGDIIFFPSSHRRSNLLINIKELDKLLVNETAKSIYFLEGELLSKCQILCPNKSKEDFEKSSFFWKKTYNRKPSNKVKLVFKRNNQTYDDPEKEFDDYQNNDSADWIGF